MNILKKTALTLSASLVLASLATAQQSRFPASAGTGDLPRAGSHEITFSGSGESDRDFDNGSLSLEGSWGWYTSDRLLFSVRQALSNLGDSRSWSGATLAAADYHFLDGPLRPFAGVNLGLRYGGNDVGDDFAMGGQVGLKYYLQGNAFVFGRADYSYTFDKVDDVNDAWDHGRWGYAFGVGLNY